MQNEVYATEYRIVSRCTPEELEEEINVLLEVGWEVSGSLVVIKSINNPGFWFIQAVILRS